MPPFRFINNWKFSPFSSTLWCFTLFNVFACEDFWGFVVLNFGIEFARTNWARELCGGGQVKTT